MSSTTSSQFHFRQGLTAIFSLHLIVVKYHVIKCLLAYVNFFRRISLFGFNQGHAEIVLFG